MTLRSLPCNIGQLKAKLAKLKRELLTPSSSGGGGGGMVTLISEGERSSQNDQQLGLTLHAPVLPA
jgi:hypothetical protein